MPSPGPATLESARSPRRVLAALAIALLAWAVYINSLTNPFVYDDYRLIVENTALTQPGNLRLIVWRDVTRPLVNLSYAADMAIWGLRPLGFHITNLLFHAINVLLVFAVARRLAGDCAVPGARTPVPGAVVIAIAASLLFAVHPMMSQAVGYVSARPDLMCTTFVLLAWLAARRALLGHGWRWLAAALVAWILALAAKEMAALLPLALLAYDMVVWHPEGRRRRLQLIHAPLLTLLGVAALARVWILVTVEYGREPIDWRLGLVAVDAVRRYLQLLLWPAGQTVFHSLAPIDSLLDVRALWTIAVLLAVAAAAWWLRRVHRLVPFGMLWFVIFLLPSGVLFVLGRGEALAEHRVYLASFGVYIAAAALFGAVLTHLGRDAPAARWLVIGVAGMVVLQLGARTMLRNAVWKDPVALWQESVAKAPDHWLPRLMLAETLRQQRGCAPAEPEYRRALQLRRSEVFTYTKLGGCLLELSRFDEAAAVFTTLRDEVAPQSAEGSTGLAILAMVTGHPDQSKHHLEDAIRRDASAVVARRLLATLVEPGDPATALRLCQEIGQLAPHTPGNDECVRRTMARVREGR